MSDSFENDSVDEMTSNIAHLQGAIAGTRITIKPFATIEYPIGWRTLVEEFIESVRHCKFTIERITYVHGMLDIEFYPTTKIHETTIWREADCFMRKSWHRCQRCGESARNLRVGYGICRECETKGHGKTGTWLDRY